MTKNDPCCLYESGGDYDDDYCLNDKSETVDAWMWRTNGESGENGKDCDYVRTTRPGSTSPATRVTNGATTWPRNRTRVAGA
jgi:hypothetical protein